jgi:RNA polymerase sigma factor (sigma-70 family)
MHDRGAHPILRFLRTSVAADEIRRVTDCLLLRRYSTQRDEAAFEVLVHRHGAMVWHVCRMVLREPHAAEDAFQATFLILVRKAGSIARPELLGNWLYGVAYRVALRVKKTSTRRELHERRGVDVAAAATSNSVAEPDLQPVLQEELQRLPAKYRSPLVLCYLEGRTNEEAARQLQWPLGTVKVRLMRGREMLRTRLVRRGLALAAVGLALAATNVASAAPPALVDATITAAILFAAGKASEIAKLSTDLVALTEGVLKTMWWTKVKNVIAMTAAVTVLAAGVGLFAFRTVAADPVVVNTKATANRSLIPSDDTDKEAKMKAEIEKLQGTWNVATLEVDGEKFPENVFKGSKIIVKGNAFTTVSMGADYKGTFTIDISKTPKTIDLTFTDGPEKGNTSLAIYELDGDTWKMCLTIGKVDRPKEFKTKAGSGLGLETLKRAAADKDEEAVKKEIASLEGDWAMVSGEIGGQAMPEEFVKSGTRMCKGNETTVKINGNVFMKATFTVDPSKKPKTIDYTMTEGPSKGKSQLGIYETDGDTVRFCFAAPGKDRPTGFTTKTGDECTLSVWKKAKK